MTTLRWDNVPKPRVERPPLLVPSSKPARRKQTPPNIKNRDEKAGQARNEPRHLSHSASTTGVGIGSARCSGCNARGVTLWWVAGSLLCGHCRPANRMAYAPQSGPRQKPDPRNAARKERTATVAGTEKDIEWAARQGVRDRKAGTECRKYKDFLRAYNLPRSPFTLRMWNAYLPSSQPEPNIKARVEGRRGPSIPPVPSQKPSSAAVAPKDFEWAARQGRRDSIARKACRKYKTFLTTYELHKSDASLRLWDAYRKQTKAERSNTPVPDLKRRSHWTRGLSISDTATPRRKYVRKYDRENSGEGELPPGIAALLMKLNQQDTLVDMWR